jgi:hypothetical protein
MQGVGLASPNIGAAKLAVDSLDNVYCINKYYNTAQPMYDIRDPSTGTSGLGNLPNWSAQSISILKRNSNGVVQIAGVINSGLYVNSYGVTIDSSDNLYISGSYDSSVQVKVTDLTTSPGGGNIVYLPASGTEEWGFIVKYNSSGVVVNASILKTNRARMTNVTIDSSNNIYATCDIYNSPIDLVIYDMTFIPGTVSTFNVAPAIPLTNGSIIIKWSSVGVALSVAIVNSGSDNSNSTFGMPILNDDTICIGGKFQLSDTNSIYKFSNIPGSDLLITIPIAADLHQPFILQLYDSANTFRLLSDLTVTETGQTKLIVSTSGGKTINVRDSGNTTTLFSEVISNALFLVWTSTNWIIISSL